MDVEVGEGWRHRRRGSGGELVELLQLDGAARRAGQDASSLRAGGADAVPTGAAADPGRNGAVPARPQRPSVGDPARQSGAKVVRQREAVLLSAAVHLPVRRRMEAAAGTAAQGRRVRGQFADERIHWHRQCRPGATAARLEQRETVLRGQDAVHIGLGQAEALHADGADVLQRGLRHRHVPQQANQGDIETVEEETVA